MVCRNFPLKRERHILVYTSTPPCWLWQRTLDTLTYVSFCLNTLGNHQCSMGSIQGLGLLLVLYNPMIRLRKLIFRLGITLNISQVHICFLWTKERLHWPLTLKVKLNVCIGLMELGIGKKIVMMSMNLIPVCRCHLADSFYGTVRKWWYKWIWRLTRLLICKPNIILTCCRH